MRADMTEKATLDWFFKGLPSANFPQAVNSSTLLDLQNALTAFVNILATASPAVPAESRIGWIALVGRALNFDANFRKDFSLTEASDLVEILNEAAEKVTLLKSVDSKMHVTAFQSLRKVLASLILYAKETRDVSFKTLVLNLVKRWDAVPQ